MQGFTISLGFMMVMLSNIQLTQAAPLVFSPFVLYSQSSEDIVIDGVSTKYALGIAGIGVQKGLNSNIKLSAKLGYGQNPNQKVSFSGATFKGQVSGWYLGLAGEYQIYETDTYALFSSTQLVNRRLSSPELSGSLSGQSLTGTADTSFDSYDIDLGAVVTLSPTHLLKFSAGLSQWRIESNATAYYASNGVVATAKKRIDTIGLDPIFKAAIETHQNDHTFSLGASLRSLQSEANTEIMTAQVNYVLRF